MTQRRCRHCSAPLEHLFLDLGYAPPSNAYLGPDDLGAPELTFPLRIRVCGICKLVQTEDFTAAEQLFAPDYAYFSSTSRSWLNHAASYSAAATARFGLGPESFVIEVASNDGYLLRNFVAAGIPCLGIEPTDATAAAAEAQGIPVLRTFLTRSSAHELADDGRRADLVVANNVFAHVPDINDFARAMALLLKPDGVATLEFPHLMRLVEFRQFDTVYHEHYSYLSLLAAERVLDAAGLRVFDLDELPTHGGSLRLYCCLGDAPYALDPSVERLRAGERSRGMDEIVFYRDLQPAAERIKDDLLRFLLDAKRDGKRVAGYGAAAKGNTLLNYAGVRPDLLPFVCDAASAKQGKFMPGSHIRILPPEALDAHPPDYVLILPWNIGDEIRAQLSHLAEKGTRFVTAIPELRVE